MSFQKWSPAMLIDKYDVEDICWNREGMVFTLLPDGLENNLNGWKITWDSSDILACHMTDETFRADCWKFDFERGGRIYLSRDSEYLRQMRQNSPLFPEEALHFLIVGTNMVVDVIARNFPDIRKNA